MPTAKKRAKKSPKAKSGSTHIVLVLDGSSSMGAIRSEVVAGVDAFIAEQKMVPGECTLTLVQFDSQEPYRVLLDAKPIAEATSIRETYTPKAMTPLYDAVGKAILDLDGKLSAAKKKPEKIVFVTMTDGAENCSREFTRDKVAALTKERESHGWHFIYLGANQDAMQVGASIGTQSANSATYSVQNVRSAIVMTSVKMAAYRGPSGQSADLSYSQKDRDDLTAK